MLQLTPRCVTALRSQVPSSHLAQELWRFGRTRFSLRIDAAADVIERVTHERTVNNVEIFC
jgi:hypothetical protein